MTGTFQSDTGGTSIPLLSIILSIEVVKDNHLLSDEERNYFDYYMYNSKYTNGPALRNRYVHGSHAAPDKENIHRNKFRRM